MFNVDIADYLVHPILFQTKKKVTQILSNTLFALVSPLLRESVSNFSTLLLR